MRLWIIEILSDFARWRAVSAQRRAKRALELAHGWLEIEKLIIMKGMRNGTEKESNIERRTSSGRWPQ